MQFNKSEKDIDQQIQKIRFILSDVDGVLTDGALLIGSDGTEYKKFHVEDHSGAALSHFGGIPIGFLSARFSKTTSIRAKEMNIDICEQGFLNKAKKFQEICNQNDLSYDEVAYIGDGFVDIPPMKLAGLSIAACNADNEVKESADVVTEKKGGTGVLKEVVKIILSKQGKMEEAMRAMKEKVYDA